jgi:S1-C subfamily serine protease
MLSRRLLIVIALATTATSFFFLGVFHARTDDAFAMASYDAKLDAIRAELRGAVVRAKYSDAHPAGTAGESWAADDAKVSKLVEEVKQELQNEMGLLPVQLLRERRSSFVELYSEDNFGKSTYGTAGYLGRGYFVTVKHAVVALPGEDNRDLSRKVVSIRVQFQGKEVPATLVDAGDADAEVHSGDWAIIKTRELNLPALNPNADFQYDFAEPIFRLGNDYSKGIIVSTGYIGQRMPNGLVTALTDGHPGVSGGGVLDRRGDLVGIPIGRMQGDYRFSFILPIRAEMLRKVPRRASAEPEPLLATRVGH